MRRESQKVRKKQKKEEEGVRTEHRARVAGLAPTGEKTDGEERRVRCPRGRGRSEQASERTHVEYSLRGRLSALARDAGGGRGRTHREPAPRGKRLYLDSRVRHLDKRRGRIARTIVSCRT